MTIEGDPHKTRHRYVLDDVVRILVTDDDPIMREFATVYLATPTASVETAEDGEEGLARLRAEPFHFALVDLDMPGIDGIEMIRQIRADPAIWDLPVMVVTSSEDVVSIDRAYEAGATSFATKPVNWRLMSYQIRYVLRAHAAAQLGVDRLFS
jgi:DNA-binding response OmpR family regulator